MVKQAKMKTNLIIVIASLIGFFTGTANGALAKPEWFSEFENKVYDDLSKIKTSLFQTLNMNNLEKRVDNCAASLSNCNDIAARKFWDAIRPQLLPENELKDLATRVLDRVQFNNRTVIGSVIRFLNSIDYPRGFEILFHKVQTKSFLYGYSEVFLLAHHYRAMCGISLGLFPKLPYIVQDVISSGVELKNVKNRGNLFGNGTSNIFTRSLHQRTKGRSLGKASLWVFNATSSGRFLIFNKYQNNVPLLDDQTEFIPELVDDQTFRILVAVSNHNTTMVGKYLAGGIAAGTEKEDILPVEFLTLEEDPERVVWTVEDTTTLGNGVIKSKYC